MYQRYAERRRWKVEIVDRDDTGIGGIKTITALIEGDGGLLAPEVRGRRPPGPARPGDGVRRAASTPRRRPWRSCPRPRTWTSRCDEKDIRVDRFCASGPGGQGVNTTYSAVRLTHLPTGLVVQCQDERSQIKNKAKAMRVLKARLLEIEQAKQEGAIAAERKKMVGSGDRSEKIRTYNFPQSRITDHRIGFTTHRLQDVLDGNLDELVEPISAALPGGAAEGRAGEGVSASERTRRDRDDHRRAPQGRGRSGGGRQVRRDHLGRAPPARPRHGRHVAAGPGPAPDARGRPSWRASRASGTSALPACPSST